MDHHTTQATEQKAKVFYITLVKTVFMMHVTVLGIDRFVNTRTSKRRFKQQSGLTDEQLKKIRNREKAQLIRQHPDEDKNNIDILLLYKEETN